MRHDEYGKVSEPLIGQPGDAAQRRLVMAARGKGNCTACHAVTDLEEFPFHEAFGPSLDGVGDR